MYDEFDPFSGNETDPIQDDSGHQDDLQHQLDEHEITGFEDGYGDLPSEHMEDLGELTPSGQELQHLEELEAPPSHPDHSHDHHDISFGSGETISCSDCSGGCGAYCAGLFG